jgi:hypothetical protein
MDSLLFMFMLFVLHDILVDVCRNNSDEYNLHQIYIRFQDADKDISLRMYMLESIDTTQLDVQMDRSHHFYNLENAYILFVSFNPVSSLQGNLHLWKKTQKHSKLLFKLKFALGQLSFLGVRLLHFLVRY